MTFADGSQNSSDLQYYNLLTLYNGNEFYKFEYFGTLKRGKLLKPTFPLYVNSVCEQKVHNQDFCQRNKLLII